MEIQNLVNDWFDKWRKGEFLNLPISNNFKHTSPFGTIEGKKAYLALVRSNKEKFLGYQFDILDQIYDVDKACVRYIARQREHFRLEVSEWYYFENQFIQEIYAYYHIGEIQDNRKLNFQPDK